MKKTRMIKKELIAILVSLIFIQCSNNTSNNVKAKNEFAKRQPEPQKTENSEPNKKEDIQNVFFEAVRKGNDTLEIENLVRNGADVNFIDKEGYYPLLLAKNRKNDSTKSAIINKLLALGALDINSLISQYFRQCEKGNIDSIDLMLNDGLNLNWTEKYYEELEEGGGCGCICEKSGIFIAAKNQNVKLVEYLIENGANVYLDEGNLQPLEPAIINSNWELAKLLLENGASKEVSICLWWGWDGLTSGSSYYHKLRFQDTTTLNFLIENSFPYPNSENYKWISTPLEHAITENDTLILRKLISLTENQKVLSKALCYARSISVANILIENGAHTNFVYSWTGEGNSGEVISPLYTAIKEEDTSLVNLYIENGADINILYDDYNGETLELPSYYEIGYPLLIAAEKGNLTIVKKLLQKGAKVNFAIRRNYCSDSRKDNNDAEKYAFWQTPLIAAVERNDNDMVELLIENGAEVIIEGDTLTNYSFGKKTDEGILNLLNSRLN